MWNQCNYQASRSPKTWWSSKVQWKWHLNQIYLLLWKLCSRAHILSSLQRCILINHWVRALSNQSLILEHRMKWRFLTYRSGTWAIVPTWKTYLLFCQAWFLVILRFRKRLMPVQSIMILENLILQFHSLSNMGIRVK